MSEAAKGTQAPSPTPAAADSTAAATDALPVSQDGFAASPPEKEADGTKQAREIYRALVKKSGSEVPAPDDEPAGEQPAGEKAATTAADAPKPTEQKPDAKEAGDAALSAARDALIRDGWTGSDLDHLPPERVLELGAKRQGQQKQQDGFGRAKSEEVAALKAKLAELEGGKPAGQPPAAADAAANTPAASTDFYADPALKEIGAELDKLGEYASPEIQQVVKGSLAKMFQTLEQRMAQKFGAVTQAAERQMLTAARVKVSENFPAVKDEAKWSAVTQKMQTLAKTGAYGPADMDTLAEDACKLVLPAPSVLDVQRKMLEASQKAQNGQMDAGQRSTTDADHRGPTPLDQTRQILRQMKKGKSAEDARRAVMV